MTRSGCEPSESSAVCALCPLRDANTWLSKLCCATCKACLRASLFFVAKELNQTAPGGGGLLRRWFARAGLVAVSGCAIVLGLLISIFCQVRAGKTMPTTGEVFVRKAIP